MLALLRNDLNWDFPFGSWPTTSVDFFVILVLFHGFASRFADLFSIFLWQRKLSIDIGAFPHTFQSRAKKPPPRFPLFSCVPFTFPSSGGRCGPISLIASLRPLGWPTASILRSRSVPSGWWRPPCVSWLAR